MAKVNKNIEKPLLIRENVTTEREIAEMQLERLRYVARDRMLSYEEVKIYDLLTKNLLLIKEKTQTSIPVDPLHKIQDQLSTKELLKLADVITEDHAINVLTQTQDESDKEN